MFPNQLIQWSQALVFFFPAIWRPWSLRRVWRSQRLLDGCCTLDSGFFEALRGRLSTNVTRAQGLAAVGDWSLKAPRKSFKGMNVGAIQEINGSERDGSCWCSVEEEEETHLAAGVNAASVLCASAICSFLCLCIFLPGLSAAPSPRCSLGLTRSPLNKTLISVGRAS